MINFNKIHQQFDGMMFDLCEKCGGKCEKNEISIFLPGEVSFIAQKLNLKKSDFVQQFCNKILYNGRYIYIKSWCLSVS